VTVNAQLASIAVTPAKPQIAKDTTQQFTATGTFNDGTHQNLTSQVTWSSSNSNIASVNNSPGLQGLATGLTAGTATITATSGAIAGSAQLNVSNANLVSIGITPATPTVNLAAVQQFTATGTFDDGTTQNISGIVTWSSSATSVATVTSTGLASAVGLGNATISASASSVPTASTVMTVAAANLSSLKITPASGQMAIGTNRQMTATATFNDGSTLDVTVTKGVNWTSSTTTVATIGPGSGLAVSQSVGTTTISVTFGSQSANTSLDVTAATIQSISVAPNNTTIAPGTNQRFTATGTFSDGSTQNITGVSNWATDQAAIATVGNSVGGSKGLATGISHGTANISASFSSPGGPSKTGSAALNVSGAVLLGLDVAPQNFVVAPATGVQYSATGQFDDGSSQSVTLAATWGSSSTSVAGVSSSGLAIGNSPGTTNITATLGSVSGSSSLLVTSSPLVSLKITAPNNGTIAQQTPEQLTATGTFADGTSQNVTGAVKWTSSTSSVATVNNGSTSRGVLTAIAPGSTTVTALLTGIVGSANITVTNTSITSIAVAPQSSSITLGSSQQFTATASISDGSSQDITRFAKWTSSDPNVAIVSPAGAAATAGTGTTTVSASMNGVTGQAILTVNP
jgi:Big-like domain-containing protein